MRGHQLREELLSLITAVKIMAGLIGFLAFILIGIAVLLIG